MTGYQNNSIFWIETEKIQPNPYQPRREFEPRALEDLADSVRQYGVLQPLVVTRKEMPMEHGHGMQVSYELIAGERRLRASKLAGLQQVPVIIRKDTDNKIKLELAIIENLQREDLNPIDRALAFEQLYKEFDLTHAQIGKKMGKSRVYVSNSLRLLSLPEEMRTGLMQGLITEGHTRPLLMLSDKPKEQLTLYKEIMLKKMSVRDSEKIARKVAQDKVRKKEFIVDPKIRDYEIRLSENLGTRVHIEPKEKGGKITIDYFTLKDLDSIMNSLKKTDEKNANRMMDRYLETQQEKVQTETPAVPVLNTQSATETLMKSTPVDVQESKSTLASMTSFSQALPEFHHSKREEIEVYKEELTTPKERLIQDRHIEKGIELKASMLQSTTPETSPKSLSEMMRDIDEALLKKNHVAESMSDLVLPTEKTEVLVEPEPTPAENASVNPLENSAYLQKTQSAQHSTSQHFGVHQQQPQGYQQNTPQTHQQPVIHHTYTGPYHNPEAGGYQVKKKSILGGLFR